MFISDVWPELLFFRGKKWWAIWDFNCMHVLDFSFWVLFSIALPFDLAINFSYHFNFSCRSTEEKKGLGIHNRKIEGLLSEFLYYLCLLVRLFGLAGICNLQMKATCRHWYIIWTWFDKPSTSINFGFCPCTQPECGSDKFWLRWCRQKNKSPTYDQKEL